MSHREQSERRRRLSPITLPAEDKVALLEMFAEILDSGHLTGGKYTAEFEREFAEIHGVRHAVAVNSGLSALTLAMSIIGVAGRSVALPSTTFIATAAAVINAGGRPVLIDMDPDTLSMSNAAVERGLESDPAAVITMHTGGYMANNISTLAEMCNASGVPLVEDAAHAHGASVGSHSAGSVGHIGAFSMFPTKVVTSGEGGVLTTNDDAVADQARMLRDHGKLKGDPDHQIVVGSSLRMSELDAALGLVQVRRLRTFIEARARIAERYDLALREATGLAPFHPGAGVTPSFYKYIVLLADDVDRDAVRQLCADEFDLSLPGLVYAVPLHRQPALRSLGDTAQPESDRFASRHLCLPITPAMTDDDAEWIAGRVLAAASRVQGVS